MNVLRAGIPGESVAGALVGRFGGEEGIAVKDQIIQTYNIPPHRHKHSEKNRIFH
jgi:hypothetical protein